MKKIALLSLFIVVTACCVPCSKSAPKIGDLENATWTLIEFDNAEIENSPITLQFSAPEKMIYGTAVCNNFFAGYTLFENERRNIRIGNVGSTLKACRDMDMELRFRSMLQSITKVKLEGDRLVMIDSLENLKAVLVKAKLQ